MKKAIVIYKSKYGYTQKYANWIAEELGAELREAGDIKTSDLLNYDVIIYGGGLYAGGLNGISLIKKSFHFIKDKELHLFTVGAADVTDDKNISNIRSSLSKALTAEMQDKTNIFHFRGGMDYTRLSLIHRIMMAMMIKMIGKKPQSELSGEERDILATYGQVIDFSDKSSIGPMIDHVKGM